MAFLSGCERQGRVGHHQHINADAIPDAQTNCQVSLADQALVLIGLPMSTIHGTGCSAQPLYEKGVCR